jgi:hypothetical protein
MTSQCGPFRILGLICPEGPEHLLTLLGLTCSHRSTATETSYLLPVVAWSGAPGEYSELVPDPWKEIQPTAYPLGVSYSQQDWKGQIGGQECVGTIPKLFL